MARSRPTTPVRRVSRGSISSHVRTSLASSGQNQQSGGATVGKGRSSNSNGQGAHATPIVTPLSFLAQAMGDLSYETSTLQSNLEAVGDIQSALHTFDESFSMFLYGLKMNAFCVEWPEAPGEENFRRAEMRRNGFRSTSSASYRPTADIAGEEGAPGQADATTFGVSAADRAFTPQIEEAADAASMQPHPVAALHDGATLSKSEMASKPALKSAMKKPSTASSSAQQSAAPSRSTAAKATVAKTAAASVPQPIKITAAEKKKRETAAEKVIEVLPLEYRGSNPATKRLMMRVLLALIAAGPKGVRINDIVQMPELPQAKVNKCMVALTAAKQVLKRSDNGIVYQLDPEKNPIAA